MRKPTPETETMKISEVKSHLSSLVNEVYRKEKRIIIEKSGIPVAAVVSMDELERLDRMQRDWDERFATIDHVREAFKDVPPEEIERNLSALVSEMRTHDEIVAERMRVINAMREAFKDVPPEEIERETAKAVAEVRAEVKAERAAIAKSA